MVPWPQSASGSTAGSLRAGVVTVNWNTRALLARVLFGLTQVLEPGLVAEIVVVDNASDDGSAELARALADAGVIRLIANREQRYHGPGLTQGVNLLAARAAAEPLDVVWAVDSDVFVLRPDVLRGATAALRAFGAVVAADPEDYEPEPLGLTDRVGGAHCLLFDPAVVWQPRHRPFLEDGEPSRHMQADLRERGHRVLAFPFCADGYVLHLGRATLAEVAARGETSNRYHHWAIAHRVPHYGLNPDGERLLAEFEARYRAAVPDDTVETIVKALATQ